MKATLLIAVALTTVALCSAADAECNYRKIRKLPLHWANPIDCTRYFRCTNRNVMREVICAEGKVYNAKTGRCAINKDGLCKLTLLAPLIEALNPCADEVSGAYIPQSGYCQNFYICNDNKAYPQTCETGSYFNSTSTNCIPDTDSECWQNKCIKQIDGTYLPDESSCSSFYVCANEQVTVQNCGNGSFFNSSSRVCEPDVTGEYCWENLCFEKSDGEFVKDLNDCYSYYVCVNAKPIKQYCPDGSYFNSFENSCVPGVCPTESTTEVTTETTTVYTEETTNSSTECPTTTTTACNEISSTTEITECPEITTSAPKTDCICPGGYKDGELVPLPDYPENCDKYYICIDGRLEERECGKGNLFDSTLGACVPDTNNVCWPIINTECPELTTESTTTCFEDTTVPSTECAELTTTTECTTVATEADCLCPGGAKNGELVPFPNYPQDCDKYYECLDGKLIEKECGQGNRFDSALGVCVPDSENICSQTDCNNQNGINNRYRIRRNVGDNVWIKSKCFGVYNEGEAIRHPKDCRKYLLCVRGEMVSRECAAGEYFELNNLQCSEDIHEVCGSNGQYNNLSDLSVGKMVGLSNMVEARADSSCDCAGGYKDGELVPFPNYPENCDKYYICTGGRLEARECGNGNRFDSTLGVCVPDNEHICSSAVTTACPDITTLAPETDCTCPGGYKEGELIPFPNYPENCDKYYICTDGRLEARECGNGNRFDSTLGVCVPDNEHICSSAVTTACSDITTLAPETDCTCPGGYKDGELVPFPNYPENCDKYYICTDGRLEERECGNGNRFDSTLGVCVPDNEHICSSPVTTACPDITTLAPETDCTCPGGYKEGELVPFPNYPENCNKYYICTNGRLEERECGVGNRFDCSLGVCVPDTDNICWPNVCKDLPNGATVADSANCTSFYLCEDGKGEIYECPAEKWFDPIYQVCMPDFNATCINPCKDTSGIIFLPNPDCSKYFLCNNGQPFIESCPSGGFDVNLGKCHENAVCEATLCVGKDDGTTFAVVGNDTMFYLCLGGVAQIDECTPGHVYNSAVGVCLEEPSSKCDQTKCNSTKPEDGAFAPLVSTDDTAFCLCRNGAAYLHHCTDNYTFRSDLGICYSNAPCDPEICDVYPENTRSQNRNDTHSFCLCVSKQQVIVDCPNNQTYNPVSRLCQTPNDKCSSTFCLSAPEYTIFPALNNDTDGFCMCLNSGPVYKSCEYGTKFDVNKDICLSVTKNVCSNSLCTGNSGLIFGASGDPHSFCYCTSDGVATKRSCPNSEIFNETLLICQAVGCDGQVCLTKPTEPFPADNEPYSFCICSSTEPSSVTKHNCPNGTRFDPYYLICKEDPCDKDLCCDSSNDGKAFPANNYPQGFCLCNKGIPVLHTCPSDSLFNSKSRLCTSATNMECDLSACRNATSENTYPVAARNDPHGFCYCFSSAEVEFFSCPGGVLFDPVRGICNLSVPENTNTPDCSCPGGYGEGQILPNPTNCRLYYVCSHGRLQEFDCGVGNTFDKATLTCQPLSRSVELPNKQLMRSEAIPEDDNFCVENDKKSVHWNCSQYEICIDSVWIRLSCPNSWYYNAEQRKCMEPRDDTICPYARIKNLPECTNLIDQRTISGKEINCAQYYRCVHGKWRLKICPKQHYYSKRFNTCIPSPMNDLCSARNETEIASGVLANQNASHSICQHMTIRAYNHNCAMYIICLDGNWWHHYCPLGMYFNRIYNYCMPNIDGQCPNALNTTIEENSRQQCDLQGSVMPTLLACNRYQECREGYWEMRDCDKYHYFNATAKLCLPDTEGICINCTEGERHEFPFNCTSYEICIRGKWHRANCNSFWIFDNLLNICVPNDGSCAANGLRKVCRMGETRAHPLAEKCTQFYYCWDDIWKMGTCLKGHTYAKETGECVPHAENDKCQPILIKTETNLDNQKESEKNISSICVGREDGSTVPHPDNCLYFFVCLSGMATNKQKCIKGSYFNAKAGYCEPNNGNCVVPLEGICSNVTDGEHVAHPVDCQAYFYCSTLNGIELLYCPDGEYFDNSTNKCRFDNGQCRFNLKKSEQCTLKHGQLLPHERYCNIYYACVRGLAILVACPAEHQFNVSVGRCIFHENLECDNGTLLEAINNTKKLYNCKNFTDGTHLPVITDCTKYIICLTGLELIKTCPSGTFFDADQHLCLPDDGSCPYVQKDETQHYPPTIPDRIICEENHGTMIPDSTNCNNFYVCINGKLHYERCYINYFFDSYKNQCIPYEHNRNLVNLTNIEIEKLHELQHLETNMNKQCNDKPTNYTQFCSRMPQDTLIAEQADCRRYINCNENGEPVSQRCRNGESFDSLLGFCRQNDGTCLLENGQRVGECNGRHGEWVRDTDNCRGYFVCINGQKISRKCAERELFDKNLATCQEDINNVCNANMKQSTKLPAVSCASLNNSTLYPYTPDNCRSYFQCINGSPIVHECADGLYFNASITRCVKDITECVLPVSTLKRAPELTYPNVCENALPGQRYANITNNCRSYYICKDDGIIISTDCPTGEIYNSESGVCEISQNAVC